jgi:hypothetical protein
MALLFERIGCRKTQYLSGMEVSDGRAPLQRKADIQSHGEPNAKMFRHPNTDVSGKPFDETTIEAVWSRAPISNEHPPMRVDAYGSLIWKAGYGNTNSKFGWEIGRKQPLSRGGKDELENLQPLQWENIQRNSPG